MTKNELGLLLHEYDVFDALQFITGAQRAVCSALFCKEVVQGLHSDVRTKSDKWLDELSEKVRENSKRNEWTGINYFPDYDISIAGVEISSLFVQDVLIRTFFQNCRNVFDILAQAANAGCLATKAKKIESVDFQKLYKTFQQEMYNQTFIDMSKWFKEVADSDEFKYIDAYCNRTKHTCSIPTKFTVPILSDDHKSTIPAFYREKETNQFEKKDVLEIVPAIYGFVSKMYHDFMGVLKKEITKRAYTDNRYYTINVYQQKYRQRAEEGFSVAYIDETTGFDSMPEKLQILFARIIKYGGENNEVVAQNCPFDTIYVKEKDSEDACAFVGKYISDDTIGTDALLRFRTYKKAPQEDRARLIIGATKDPKQRGKFYRVNHFFAVKTISDDDGFLQMANLVI